MTLEKKFSKLLIYKMINLEKILKANNICYCIYIKKNLYC